MKATNSQQEALFALGQIDQSIARVRDSISQIESGQSTAELRAKLFETSSRLIDVRNRTETLKTDQTRADFDLKTVEQRIQRDKERLLSTSSAKDIQGIEAELTSLAKRQSDLEDIELAIMDELEQASAQLATVVAEKAAIDDLIRKQEEVNNAELMKLRSQLSLDVAARVDLSALVGAELLAAYEKKSSKGVAIGRLSGRECGACRMSLTVTDYNQVSAMPADEIAVCPECNAFLIRAA